MYIIIEYMKQTICIYAFAALLLGGCISNNELTIPTNLRTEYLTEPIGLDTSSPRFTWEYSGNEEGFKASRYEVRIGTSPDDLRPYAEGMALKPHTRYYWNVAVITGMLRYGMVKGVRALPRRRLLSRPLSSIPRIGPPLGLPIIRIRSSSLPLCSASLSR